MIARNTFLANQNPYSILTSKYRENFNVLFHFSILENQDQFGSSGRYIMVAIEKKGVLR